MAKEIIPSILMRVTEIDRSLRFGSNLQGAQFQLSSLLLVPTSAADTITALGVPNTVSGADNSSRKTQQQELYFKPQTEVMLPIRSRGTATQFKTRRKPVIVIEIHQPIWSYTILCLIFKGCIFHDRASVNSAPEKLLIEP